MVTAEVCSGPEGFERRTFECLKCGHTESQILACDPLKSNAVGWLSGELGRPAVTHDIRDGVMRPRSAK
jgi:hypothetical protein